MQRFTLRRGGFTLVELLVVMAIMILVVTTVVAFGPGLRQDQRVSNAAEQVQGWLFIAKQRAYRDKKPRGIRLLSSTTTADFVTELQFIEQPDDIAGVISSVSGTSVDLDQDLTAADGVEVVSATNQAGSFLHVPGETPPCHRGHLIKAVSLPRTLTLETGLGPLPPSPQYSIVRSMKPMAGEPNLFLPSNTGIHQGFSVLPSGSLDIVFGPNGQLLGTEQSKVVFWVADTTVTPASLANQMFRGKSALICVYAKTGMIASFPVDSGADPYAFTNTGRPSGL